MKMLLREALDRETRKAGWKREGVQIARALAVLRLFGRNWLWKVLACLTRLHVLKTSTGTSLPSLL